MRLSRAYRFFFGALVAIPIVVACGKEASIELPQSLPNNGGGMTLGVEAGSPNDANACERVVADASAGVFVAADGVTSKACGGLNAPCKTVALGITQAIAASKANVYVASGTYIEHVELQAGITLVGGWDATAHEFSRACDSPEGVTILRATPADNVTVGAHNLGGNAGLAMLRVESKAQADVGAGESLYGLLATGATTLTLNDVTIVVAHGGDGTDGTDGDDGAASINVGCAPSTGADGAAGTQGAGATTGTFLETGYSAGAGSSGNNGSAGKNGVSPGDGTCVMCGTCDAECAFTGDINPTCGDNGKSGCGGTGGNGGAGGMSGGSSIGVYAWDAAVQIAHSSVQAGNGGNGGNGGAGGAGGAGTDGVEGLARAACTTACDANAQCNEVASIPVGGKAGGTGGTGGTGGAGGGGAGGWSIATYQGGTGLVTLTDTTLAHGTAGHGGSANESVGADGIAADRRP